MQHFQFTGFILIGVLLAVASALPPSPKTASDTTHPCGSEKNCTDDKAGAVCRYDDDKGCIRKYASKCHLKLEACQLSKNFTDYSDVYCSMDTFLCEEGFERWTIFFGNENN